MRQECDQVSTRKARGEGGFGRGDRGYMGKIFKGFGALLVGSALAATPAMAADFDLAEVDRRSQQLIKQRGMVGMAVAVIDDGEIVFAKGYGKTEAGRTGNPVTEDTVFRWASLSKSVAAATALSVADEGHFGLPTKVESVLGDVLPERNSSATLEHVLSHQVGLPRNAYDGKVEDNQSKPRIKGHLLEADTICTPGLCHSYQNVAYDLSADMVEAATGVPYKSVVNARIFEPLGMETATLSLDGLHQSRSWAKPHNSAGARYSHVKPTYYRVPAAAGVNSSIEDAARWLIANMDPDGEVVPVDVQGAMQTARTATPRRGRQVRRKWPFLSNAGYGLGWRTYNYEGGGKVVAHRGAVQGYRANAMFDPVTQDGVVILWNSNSSRPHGLAYEVMDQAYGKRRVDWLRMNRAKPRRVAKATPKRRPKAKTTVLAKAPLKTTTRTAELTDREVERIRRAEEQRLWDESLAATCPCPEDERSGDN